jgi:hypothetical protein
MPAAVILQHADERLINMQNDTERDATTMALSEE